MPKRTLRFPRFAKVLLPNELGRIYCCPENFEAASNALSNWQSYTALRGNICLTKVRSRKRTEHATGLVQDFE